MPSAAHSAAIRVLASSDFAAAAVLDLECSIRIPDDMPGVYRRGRKRRVNASGGDHEEIVKSTIGPNHAYARALLGRRGRVSEFTNSLCRSALGAMRP